MKRIKKSFMLLVVSISAMMLFGITGNAYIDPSVTTFMIQAIAGVVIAIGAVIGIYFRRAKKKIDKKLNIDENRNKEVESDEVVITDKKESEEK